MDNEERAKAAKALSHPLRIELLTALQEAPISPVEFSRAHNVPLGNTAYHMKVLRGLGVVKVVGEIPRRGAVEHRYGLDGGAGLIGDLLDVMAKA